ncbi:hypothetical protein HETIRDRAFT_239532, partial [Heterobasidion irregulare TC 32-1]
MDGQPLSLQAFLQLLTASNLPITRAMAVAAKIYKQHNTPARLGRLTNLELANLGIADKDDRKLVLAAIAKAGYRAQAAGPSKVRLARDRYLSSGPHTPAAPPPKSPPPRPKKRRKRAPAADLSTNEFLPERSAEDATELSTLDFDELLDEAALATKSTVVNRAPIMMAWAFIVAERLGFQRAEALSIASVYTEMNAISKGVALNIFPTTQPYTLAAADASPHGAQPYVTLLSRRVPLLQTAAGTWRALALSPSAHAGPAPPGAAHAYIARALKHTAPAVLGALRLLAASYADADALNRDGWALYAAFRPAVDGWGQRGEVRCATILGLRK